MTTKSVFAAMIFFAIGVFFIWYAGFDLLARDIGVAYGIFSVLVLSILGAQLWND